MFGLLKGSKPAPAPAAPRVAPGAPARAPARIERLDVGQAANQRDIPTLEDEVPAPVSVQGSQDADTGVIKAYVDIPKFLRVMTAGEQPIFRLPPRSTENVVAIEIAGRKALIITAEESPVPQQLIESMRGAFIAESYSVLPVRRAPAAVIAQIYAAASGVEATAGSGQRSTNVFMATVHEWLEYAVKNRATDIHIETRGSVGKVRFRIDGEMETMRSVSQGTYPASTVEKCMGSLFNNEQQRKSGSDSLFAPGKNLYCMVPYSEIPGHSLKLRYQSLKGNEGPKTVLRLLPVNENARTLTFEELGYAESHVKLWRMAMGTPSGAVLIAGITGSGKSTTQKTFIEINPNAPYSAIYTVEDPVEYPIRFAHQIPIQRDLSNPTESAMLYSDSISALMRADPDIAMLGEIRDRYSASAAQQLTETGHLALGTVHAHLLSGIIPRLVNPEIGMNREVLTAPNMLTLLVYQALVPKLCPHCAHESEEAEELFPDVAEVVEQLRRVDLPLQSFRWKRLAGCQHCNERGTVGQTVVAEMLMPDEDWLKPIREGRDVDAVTAYRNASDGDLTSANMDGKTVFEHTLFKAFTGLVDARQCSRFDNFGRFVNRYKKISTK